MQVSPGETAWDLRMHLACNACAAAKEHMLSVRAMPLLPMWGTCAHAS